MLAPLAIALEFLHETNVGKNSALPKFIFVSLT